uniref:Uncharacterized protein n=1 Tax=viral metagenome TaxID=1070528 RepID=A0A6M3KZX2_9ZZZZ
MDKVKVFCNRKGINFFRWLWSRTNLFQIILVGDNDKTILKAIDIVGKDTVKVVIDNES